MGAIEVQVGDASEAERVVAWRREELARAGYDERMARMVADVRDVDLHLATELVRRGCPPETAVKILL